jgi:hypothetical protein
VSDVLVVSPANFPQTGDNRARSDALAELASYVGGESRPEVIVRAGRALDAAVRGFNDVAWRFNRVTEDITLVADTKTYSLSTNWRNPIRAQVVDSNSLEQITLGWVPYELWIENFWNQESGGPQPQYYTALNIHNAGTVRYEPFPTGTLTHPTVRHTYHKRIAIASGSGDKLNVPVEVDEAIFMLAKAKLIEQSLPPRTSQAAYILARERRFAVEREWRDWPEITSAGWGPGS